MKLQNLIVLKRPLDLQYNFKTNWSMTSDFYQLQNRLVIILATLTCSLTLVNLEKFQNSHFEPNVILNSRTSVILFKRYILLAKAKHNFCFLCRKIHLLAWIIEEKVFKMTILNELLSQNNIFNTFLCFISRHNLFMQINYIFMTVKSINFVCAL